MKKKWSDETYHTANDLEKLLDEIESKVKTYIKKRQELYWKIKKEKEDKKEDKKVATSQCVPMFINKINSEKLKYIKLTEEVF